MRLRITVLPTLLAASLSFQYTEYWKTGRVTDKTTISASKPGKILLQRRSSAFAAFNDDDTKKESFYNDDCFGFVFLNTAFVTQDVFFCSTFVALSAMAAVATRLTSLPDRPLLPGVVAISARLASFLASPDTANIQYENGGKLQTAVCLISFIYALVQDKRTSSTES